MNSPDYVQYGCGLSAPSYWRNFDVSPTLRVRRIPVLGDFLVRQRWIPDWPINVEPGDIVSGLPIKSSSCQAIYCSHVLEHLALEDFRMALRNTYDYLGSDGTFRFVLPDLEFYIHKYVESEAVDAALSFMEDTSLGKKTRPRGLVGMARELFGSGRHHLWLWDYKAISRELKQAGFENIRRAEFGDSPDPNFRAVEAIGRWENCLGIECKKL